MNSLAELALEHARLKLSGKPQARPPSTAGTISIQPMPAISTNMVIDGPINHFMFLEGRRHAIDLASSLSALPKAEVIANLNRSAIGRPASYILGIKSIIDAIKELPYG